MAGGGRSQRNRRLKRSRNFANPVERPVNGESSKPSNAKAIYRGTPLATPMSGTPVGVFLSFMEGPRFGLHHGPGWPAYNRRPALDRRGYVLRSGMRGRPADTHSASGDSLGTVKFPSMLAGVGGMGAPLSSSKGARQIMTKSQSILTHQIAPAQSKTSTSPPRAYVIPHKIR